MDSVLARARQKRLFAEVVQRGDGVEPRHVIANPTLDRGLLYRSTAERNRSISASASSI